MVKVRPEFCATHECIAISSILFAAGEVRRPARHKRAVGGGLAELGEIKIDILASVEVGRDDDELAPGRVVRRGDVVVSCIKDAHTLADVARELSEDKELLLDGRELRRLEVADDQAPAGGVYGLPVRPCGGVQPVEVKEEVLGELGTGRVPVAVFAVPYLEAGRRRGAVQQVPAATSPLVTMYIDAPNVFLRGRVEAGPGGQTNVVGVLIGSGHCSGCETATIQLGAEGGDDLCHGCNTEVAALLVVRRRPPTGAGLVERLNRRKGDTPVIMGVLGDGREIHRMIYNVP